MYEILGLVMLYSVIHFFIIQNDKAWKKRTTYEKIVTSVWIAVIVVVFLWVMFP